MATTTITLREMVDAVKGYALAHYEEGAWDTVVETMDDWAIAEVVKYCSSKMGAVSKVAKEIAPYGAYRKEIEATAF